MKFLARLLDRIAGETLKRRVRFDDRGFAIVPYEAPEYFVEWLEVREVFGFKHDLFSVDEVCLGFRLDDADQYIWASEEDVGFKDFRSEVERRFQIEPEWFGKVAFPAFQENRTSLWTRE